MLDIITGSFRLPLCISGHPSWGKWSFLYNIVHAVIEALDIVVWKHILEICDMVQGSGSGDDFLEEGPPELNVRHE